MADLTGALQAAAGTAASAGGAADPNFNQTVLLLHGDGTNGAQNNTFLDSSTNNFTITRNGNTTQGSFSPFSNADGEWSNFFDSSAYLSHSAALIGSTTSTFTVEGWVYLTATPTTSFDISSFCGLDGQGNGANNFMSFGPTSDSKITLRWFDGATKSAKSTNTLALNTWYYIACVVNANAISLYINGVSEVVTGTSTLTNRSGSSSESYVGGKAHTYATLAGYISNVKVSSVARTITAQTAPLSSDANTILLTCQSNRFVDNSTSPKALTIGGSPSVQPFSPFAPSAAYSPSVNGGSGYFDGTGDYLSVASSSTLAFGTGDFTIEGWYYPLAYSGNTNTILSTTTADSASVAAVNVNVNTDGSMRIGGLYTTGAGTVPLNAWTHFVVSRVSGTIRLFTNGVQRSSAANTTNYTSAGCLIGGRYAGAAYYLTAAAYIAGLKFTAGSGVTSVTVPSAPPTGGNILLNFTNAGIFDNTGKNNLETVGNAQIDTTTKKFGTGSMEFDGTGDWLKVPNSPDLQLGTGDFTIEFWVYLASGDTGSARGLVAKGGASTGWLVSLDSSEKVVFTYTTSTITSSGAITTNAWNHIAVVREGTGSNETKIYIGGTNDGTGTVSTDFNQTSVMYVGANRTGGDPMKGFIDDLRITKGVARYTTGFTPPTAALPDL